MDKLNGDIIIYQTEDGLTKIDVKIENETVWLSQQQMAELFSTSRTNIIEHINNIYSEEELDKNSTCQNFRQVQKEGNRSVTREIPFYNLDMIISLGYRIKSKVATKFSNVSTKHLCTSILVLNLLYKKICNLLAPSVAENILNSNISPYLLII